MPSSDRWLNTLWGGRVVVALLAVALAGLLAAGCGLFQTQRGKITLNKDVVAAWNAERVYEEAWHTVLEDYVDPTFNGQDWYRWKDAYRGQLKDEEDARVAIQTMLASLNDEYTRFLSRHEMNEQTMSIDSRLYGVGVQISMKDSKLLVVATLEDTPADHAGLKPLDIITHINGKETTGLTVEQAADRIRGEKGTPVTLSIKRGEQMFTRKILRDEIKIKSVFSKDLKDKQIGYIRLSSFISETTVKEMAEMLIKMRNKKALILDLRENYGGLLTNAVEVADMFLDKGDIVSIVDRKQDRRVFQATAGQVFNKPLVILIDGGTASASEILSGALKDNQRAALIGTQTFGKGLVQKINPLQDGSGLNITISKYLTPNGVDINKTGIAPSQEVHFTEKDFLARRDVQLEKAVAYLEHETHLARR
ncbi:MAG: S41 family peptidase [Candidatus Melainabacteria bacterium]